MVLPNMNLSATRHRDGSDQDLSSPEHPGPAIRGTSHQSPQCCRSNKTPVTVTVCSHLEMLMIMIMIMITLSILSSYHLMIMIMVI